MESATKLFAQLQKQLEGEVRSDSLYRSIYATDASVYRKIPLGVAFPKHEKDIQNIVLWAKKHQIAILPRAAGTSLAGQCVGDGLIVDCSKYLTQLSAVDTSAQTITVGPGIIRDDLNRGLAPTGLFFGPNTSTSNRCTIGGMFGNNSSGTTSIKYGVTRDKILAVRAVLHDGSIATFTAIDRKTFESKCQENTSEGKIYASIQKLLSSPEAREDIRAGYPHPSIHRRNTGYALDYLLDFEGFGGKNPLINLAPFLCGSEGTLAFATELKIQLDPIAPKHRAMIAAHFHSVSDSLQAVVSAMQSPLYLCELMDKTILDCTLENRAQKKNRFFIEGDPKAILMLELAAHTEEALQEEVNTLLERLQKDTKGYAYPLLKGKEIDAAIHLRKAGLGLLGNIIGDKKAVACIEDTAVRLEDLPAYIEEFTALMDDFQQEAVYYAHAGAGELHLRPILNLKKKEDVVLFKKITHATAFLVKKYHGAFSGEHGDGIVRSSFIPLMLGEANYQRLQSIKLAFDPDNRFNPGKIVSPFPMVENLRYEADRVEPEVDTLMDFSDSLGMLRAVEKCNGSGDCRKSIAAGGTMCPSYRGTKDEKDTTRARANMLREMLTNPTDTNAFNNADTKKALDLCLSCKACASECPSSVDMATYKAEFLYQYYQSNPMPLASKMLGNATKYNKIASKVPSIYNAIIGNAWTSKQIKKSLGIATARSLPKVSKESFSRFMKGKKRPEIQSLSSEKSVVLFVDEFTNYLEAEIAKDAYHLLLALGYEVYAIHRLESGRSQLSKGLLKEANAICLHNLEVFTPFLEKNLPIIGLEPSALLSFRDEYQRLAPKHAQRENLAKLAFTIEEFLSQEMDAGKISPNAFTMKEQKIKIHVHCHQKSLSTSQSVANLLNFPSNYQATIMPTGCCGMAGSFGFEKEHFALSEKIAQSQLIPRVERSDASTIICATGTSCRHQIQDFSSRESLHPVQILWRALVV